MPLWLDEGLAEYFEVPRGQRGLNRAHLELLRGRLEQGQWQPSLSRLEGLDRAFDLTQEDYAKCWAWVHFLLNTHGEHNRLFHEYLRDLRQYGAAEPLGARFEHPGDRADWALVEHLRRLPASSGRQAAGSAQ